MKATVVTKVPAATEPEEFTFDQIKRREGFYVTLENKKHNGVTLLSFGNGAVVYVGTGNHMQGADSSWSGAGTKFVEFRGEVTITLTNQH